MKTEDAPDIIEILDDDTGAFGERPAPPPLHDAGGPRWIGPLAAAALVGLIAYGIATSASGGTPQVATPASSTTAVTRTTPPAPTTTVPEPLVPYYAAEPPREYRLQFVDIVRSAPLFQSNGYQLWAKPGSTGTSGSWFSIAFYPGRGDFAFSAYNAYRIDADDGSSVISYSGSGRLNVQHTGELGSVFVNALGWSDDELLDFVRSITVDDGVPSFPASSLTAGYEMVSSIEPWFALQGSPIEQVYYSPTADPSRGIGISVAPFPPADGGGDAADREIGFRFMFDRATAFTVDGHPAVAGELIDGDGYALASWIAGDHIVSVGGNLSVPDLIAIARTVHTVSPEEWNGMQFQATHNASEPNNGSGEYTQTTPSPVSYGTDSSGRTWTIHASIATVGTLRQVMWEWAGSGGWSSKATADPQINTVVEMRRSYVLADLPRAVAATAELHVIRPGLDPVVVPFIDADPTLDRTFAAYAFTEPGRYAAEVVGPDGTVLATWPPS